MIGALHTRAAGQARAAIDEIQAAVGVLAILHAGDLITDADMAAAVRCIEAQLAVIGGALDVATRPEDERLPIMTLTEIVAEARRQSPRAGLQLVQGGKA